MNECISQHADLRVDGRDDESVVRKEVLYLLFTPLENVLEIQC